MPACNAAGTLSCAISSTLRAMPDDAELLIFDDASDDGMHSAHRYVFGSLARADEADKPFTATS